MGQAAKIVELTFMLGRQYDVPLVMILVSFTYIFAQVDVRVTGKVLVGLSSPAITALSGTVSRSKHM